MISLCVNYAGFCSDSHIATIIYYIIPYLDAIRGQNTYLKLVSHLLERETLLHIVNNSPVKIHSKCFLPNWTWFSCILKWVGKCLIMVEHYFELLY